jgi:hypothetical protein
MQTSENTEPESLLSENTIKLQYIGNNLVIFISKFNTIMILELSPQEGPNEEIIFGGGDITPSPAEPEECSEKNFLSGDTCRERANYPIDNCVSYDTSFDKCYSCAQGFYLGSGGVNCEEFPKNIQHCVKYDQEKECVQCDVHMYLENNTCVSIPVNVSHN